MKTSISEFLTLFREEFVTKVPNNGWIGPVLLKEIMEEFDKSSARVLDILNKRKSKCQS